MNNTHTKKKQEKPKNYEPVHHIYRNAPTLVAASFSVTLRAAHAFSSSSCVR